MCITQPAPETRRPANGETNKSFRFQKKTSSFRGKRFDIETRDLTGCWGEWSLVRNHSKEMKDLAPDNIPLNCWWEKERKLERKRERKRKKEERGLIEIWFGHALLFLIFMGSLLYVTRKGFLFGSCDMESTFYTHLIFLLLFHAHLVKNNISHKCYVFLLTNACFIFLKTIIIYSYVHRVWLMGRVCILLRDVELNFLWIGRKFHFLVLVKWCEFVVNLSID